MHTQSNLLGDWYLADQAAAGYQSFPDGVSLPSAMILSTSVGFQVLRWNSKHPCGPHDLYSHTR